MFLAILTICIACGAFSCDENYYGKYCNITTCNDVYSNDTTVCSGHGDCVAFEYCNCTEDLYVGEFCHLWSCWGVAVVDDEVCGGEERGLCVDYDLCYCKPGYFSESPGGDCIKWYCGTQLNTEEGVCSDRGNCTATQYCECEEIYDGDLCEFDTCSDISANSTEVCNGHGDCLAHDDCNCTDIHYVGEFCQFWTCWGISTADLDNVCGGNGACINVNYCFCQIGYASLFDGGVCDQWYCGEYYKNDTEACSGHGVCVGSDICDCRDAWFGDLCEIDPSSGVSVTVSRSVFVVLCVFGYLFFV